MSDIHENAPSPTGHRPRWRIPVAIVAFVFGALTVKSGGSVLFIDGADRAAAGDYVPFVLWFNFLAGFAYMVAAMSIYFWKASAAKLAVAIAVLTILVFAALGIHILMGGAYEMRTVYAMTLRSVVWLSFATMLMRAQPGQT